MTIVEKYIDQNQELFMRAARDIWEYAEVAYKEVKPLARLMGLLKDNGFRVQAGVGAAPTAFIAEYGMRPAHHRYDRRV